MMYAASSWRTHMAEVVPSAAENCTSRVLRDVHPATAATGPRCLSTALAFALSGHPTGPTERDIARGVFVDPSGIGVADAQARLEQLGWSSLSFQAPLEATARLVEAGFPVVVFVNLGVNRRHAVTATGVRRAREGDTCSTALEAVEIFDPLTGQRRWEAASALAAIQSEQQQLVPFEPNARDALDDRGFPLSVATEMDARFRASALLKEAASHSSPNDQSRRLLERARSIAPNWEPAQRALEAEARGEATTAKRSRPPRDPSPPPP